MTSADPSTEYIRIWRLFSEHLQQYILVFYFTAILCSRKYSFHIHMRTENPTNFTPIPLFFSKTTRRKRSECVWMAIIRITFYVTWTSFNFMVIPPYQHTTLIWRKINGFQSKLKLWLLIRKTEQNTLRISIKFQDYFGRLFGKTKSNNR